MNSRPNVNKLIIALAIFAGVALTGIGAAALARRSSGGVDVYPVSDLITDADWITDTQIEGFVASEQNQSVYVSSTQQVTEVYVQEGQAVNAGDPVLAFDTTLTELELDRQRIKVEQLKLDIKDAEEELRIIGTLRASSGASGGPQYIYVPYTPSPSPSAPEPVEETPAPSDEELVPVPVLPYERARGALGTRDDPFVYLWNDNCRYSQSFFRQLVTLSAERRGKTVQEDEGTPDGPEEGIAPEESPAPEEGIAPEESPAPEESLAPVETSGESVYVVFEVRRSDALTGELLRVWEMEITFDGGNWSFRVIDPVYSVPEEGTEALAADPGRAGESYGAFIDTSASYTAAQIAEMRKDCTVRIRELGQELKMAELTYENLKYEFSNGEVTSKLDGVVETVIDVDEARLENKPMVVISGGGGYYVTAALGEMDLDTLAEGDAVTVQSWESGGQSEGYITEISEYPDENGRFWYYGNGNRNVSMYPFKVYVDTSAGLREGEYVTVSPAGKEESSDSMFLDVSFVRQESGTSYVYAVGEDGRLEQRTVQTGRNLWGSYIEILSGLTEEESIAFPYGRKTRDGAKVRYAEIQELYASMYY